MLTYAEEILLLALDDETGALRPLPINALRYALAGALLVELALTQRIDTDLQGLYVINAKPLGEPLLDPLLARLTQSAGDGLPTSEALELVGEVIPDLQDQVLQELVAKGILNQVEHRILWVFSQRRYPVADDREVQEVRARLRSLVLSDEIPEPRDAILIALANACRLLDSLFSESELARLRPRIDALSRLELIGREVADAIQLISRVVAESMTAMP